MACLVPTLWSERPTNGAFTVLDSKVPRLMLGKATVLILWRYTSDNLHDWDTRAKAAINPL
jgi:hypothetical protein